MNHLKVIGKSLENHLNYDRIVFDTLILIDTFVLEIINIIFLFLNNVFLNI